MKLYRRFIVIILFIAFTISSKQLYCDIGSKKILIRNVKYALAALPASIIIFKSVLSFLKWKNEQEYIINSFLIFKQLKNEYIENKLSFSKTRIPDDLIDQILHMKSSQNDLIEKQEKIHLNQERKIFKYEKIIKKQLTMILQWSFCLFVSTSRY